MIPYHSINIKKDALWKPLLRQFRRFVKKTCHAELIAKAEELNSMKTSQFKSQNTKFELKQDSDREDDDEKDQSQCTEGCTPQIQELAKKVTFDTVMSKALTFFDALSLSKDIARNERNSLAVFLLVQSQKVTRQRGLLPNYKAVMRKYLNEIQINFFQIFNENSKQSRCNFFKDPLIQILWTRFL